MGSCMSKNAAVESVNPVPHPEARRMWIVSTPVDSKDVPLDLVGIDADGLKSAMRNRGLETEHWALKVDPLLNEKAESKIFDITLEGDRLVPNVHTPSSPYWRGITRRVVIGWTIWKDDEIVGACKLLIQARPKYDGRTNNSQQLARLLGKHIEFTLPTVQPSSTTSDATIIATVATATATATATDSSSSSLMAPTPAESGEGLNNRSQRTLVSGHNGRNPSSDTDDRGKHGLETSSGSADSARGVPASIRRNHRNSVARPPLVHLPTAPAGVEGTLLSPERPGLQRAGESEQITTPSVRISMPPSPRQYSQPSPLSPDQRRPHRYSTLDVPGGRSRSRSDVSQINSSLHGRGRSMGEVPPLPSSNSSRRRSAAPTEWLNEMPGNDSRFNSVRSKSGAPRSNQHRESIISLGGGVASGPPYGSWGPNNVMNSSPSMSGLPMGAYGMMPNMNMGMNMWPGMTGSLGPSASMGFHPGMMQAAPMPFFPPHHGLTIPFMPNMPSMPMLAPPSPGFYSHTSSAVPTPPESPNVSVSHLPKGHIPDIESQLRQGPQIRA